MIEILTDMPAGVLGFRASGKVTAEDYQDVLAPAVEGALLNYPKLRLYYDIAPDFESYEFAAMWEDAKIGLRHLTAWRRIAVVCDLNWLKLTMRGFGWLVPCPFRIYPRERMAEARDWISDPGTSGLIANLDPETAVLTLEPHGQLEKEDFEQLNVQVDAFLEEHEALNGIMISTKSFPGWDGIDAMLAHLKFVRDHQRQVKHVAIVTDGRILSHFPALARAFVSAEVKHFPAGEEEAALSWMQGGA